MSVDPGHLELLWRQLDGEPLTAVERATLDAALASDPRLQVEAELRRGTRHLARTLPSEGAPSALADRLSAALRDPRAVAAAAPPPAKVLVFGLPVQRFALVATLLIAVLGFAYMNRSAPPSHEASLVRTHVAALESKLEFQPVLAAVQDDPEWLELGALDLPAERLTLTGQRDCNIVDCPSTQYFGTLADGTPISVFIVHFAGHFHLEGWATAEPALHRDYGVMRGAGATMVAWEDHDQVYALVAERPAAELLALAESSRATIASLPGPFQLAALPAYY